MFPTVFKYIALALEISTAAEAVIMLIQADTQLTGAQLQLAIQPALDGLHQALPKFNPPPEVTTDILNAAAAAINKYVLHLP